MQDVKLLIWSGQWVLYELGLAYWNEFAPELMMMEGGEFGVMTICWVVDVQQALGDRVTPVVTRLGKS